MKQKWVKFTNSTEDKFIKCSTKLAKLLYKYLPSGFVGCVLLLSFVTTLLLGLLGLKMLEIVTAYIAVTSLLLFFLQCVLLPLTLSNGLFDKIENVKDN